MAEVYLGLEPVVHDFGLYSLLFTIIITYSYQIAHQVVFRPVHRRLHLYDVLRLQPPVHQSPKLYTPILRTTHDYFLMFAILVTLSRQTMPNCSK